MDDLDLEGARLADQARRLSAFLGATKPSLKDRFFLVVGGTGSGKSTFVARCTGKDAEVGHRLHSCTRDIDAFDFTWSGRRIYLIDTPGFNDTSRSDVETLGILAAYLGASYANGVRIHGLIMLHSISDNRMAGSGLRKVEVVKAMCGPEFYGHMAIATTMWPEAPSYAERATLEGREAQLKREDRFFGSLIAQGAVMFRHDETGRRNVFQEMASARHIVAHLVRQSDVHAPDGLQLQRELIDHRKALGETEAGVAAAQDLYKARLASEHQLRDIDRETKGGVAGRNADAAYAAELRELRSDVEKKLTRLQEDGRALKSSLQDMLVGEGDIWRKNVQALEARYRDRLPAKERELRDMEASLREARREMARPTWRNPAQQQEAVREAARAEERVANAREDLGRARGADRDFREKTGSMLGGIAKQIGLGLVKALGTTLVSAAPAVCSVM